MGCQIEVLRSVYKFLDSDSYLDCSFLVKNFSKTQILTQLIREPDRAISSLTAAHINEVIETINQYRVHSKADRRAIAASLNPPTPSQ